MVVTEILHLSESLAYMLAICALLLLSVLPLGLFLVSKLNLRSPHLKAVLSLALGSTGLAVLMSAVFLLHKSGMPLELSLIHI